MTHTVKDFSIGNEADVLFLFPPLEFSSLLYHPTDVGDFISSSSAFSKSTLYIWKYIWKFLVHILLRPNLKDFEHYLTSMWILSETCSWSNYILLSVSQYILLSSVSKSFPPPWSGQE